MVKNYKPMILVFAGANGSGKSTITGLVDTIGKYVNADEIKKSMLCSDLAAAECAEQIREQCVDNLQDFTFETVLSTPRNLELLKRAKEKGYFIKSFYVLTSSPEINIARVQTRAINGGHDVPVDKIRSRYTKTLAMLPSLIKICDICNVYDNSLEQPERIFSKKLGTYRLWETATWNKEKIIALTHQQEYTQMFLKPTNSVSVIGSTKRKR